jgi:hypothetical protein
MWSRFMCLGVRVQAAYVLQAHSHIAWERGKSVKIEYRREPSHEADRDAGDEPWKERWLEEETICI